MPFLGFLLVFGGVFCACGRGGGEVGVVGAVDRVGELDVEIALAFTDDLVLEGPAWDGG